MRYFRVTVLRGHSHYHHSFKKGKKKQHAATLGDTITFNIAANSLLEACDIARRKPSVKHDSPQAVRKAWEITYDEFVAGLGSNAYEAALGAEYKKKGKNQYD